MRYKVNTLKCSSIDINLNGCGRNAINDTGFCKKHNYMVDYTEEMMSNLQACSGCKKMYYIPDGKTCPSCRDRGRKNVIKKRENVVLCANDGCAFKRSKENTYCNKHQLCIFIDDTVAIGKKVCKQYIRGCRTQLDLDYQYSRCQICLERDREQDNKRRVTAQNSKKTDTHQTCPTCCKTFENSLFVGVNGGSTKTCKNCRDSNQIQDQKRDKVHVNALHRISDKKPERLAKKAEWKESNYDKVALYCMNHRQRQIDQNIGEYLDRNAQHAKQRRDNNPDKVTANNQNKKNNINLQYMIYSRSARDKRLDFEISQEDFNDIVKESCHYCDIIQERGFNGIDRLDSTMGYVTDNCVSCCKTCNYMKCSLSAVVFLKRIEHILTHNNKIDGRYFPEEVCDTNAACYNEYNTRAQNKLLSFELTTGEYNTITTLPCYLCGRKSWEECKNGIDRVDNKLGYIMCNVKPCCGSCNYMKKDMELNDLFDKMTEIYLKSKIKVETTLFVSEAHNPSKNIVKNANKKTTDEKHEEACIRKQKQREILKEKYCDEEYKQRRATELADCRKSKNETTV
jgi:hypothetical protein